MSGDCNICGGGHAEGGGNAGRVLDPATVNLEDSEHTVDAPSPSPQAQDRAAYEASIRDVYGLSEFVATLQADRLEAAWKERRRDHNLHPHVCADCGQVYPTLNEFRGHWKVCPGEEAAGIRAVAEERDALKANAVRLRSSLHIADLRAQDAEDRFTEERERKRGAVENMLEASRRADKLKKELAQERDALERTRAELALERDGHTATSNVCRDTFEKLKDTRSERDSLRRQVEALRATLEYYVSCFRLDAHDGTKVLGVEIGRGELAKIQAALEVR